MPGSGSWVAATRRTLLFSSARAIARSSEPPAGSAMAMGAGEGAGGGAGAGKGEATADATGAAARAGAVWAACAAAALVTPFGARGDASAPVAPIAPVTGA
ncbi:MAG TPA: hypothetical protein VN903_05510 [Polyangia bacterium]|nr:hypothetical protein [Polyangia bacterium]